MTTINDARTGKTRRSENLRGLVDHARRQPGRGFYWPRVVAVLVEQMSSEANYAAHVTVKYPDGSIGQACFADVTIAKRWARRFAESRGGVSQYAPFGCPAVFSAR